MLLCFRFSLSVEVVRIKLRLFQSFGPYAFPRWCRNRLSIIWFLNYSSKRGRRNEENLFMDFSRTSQSELEGENYFFVFNLRLCFKGEPEARRSFSPVWIDDHFQLLRQVALKLISFFPFVVVRASGSMWNIFFPYAAEKNYIDSSRKREENVSPSVCEADDVTAMFWPRNTRSDNLRVTSENRYALLFFSEPLPRFIHMFGREGTSQNSFVYRKSLETKERLSVVSLWTSRRRNCSIIVDDSKRRNS